MREIKFRGFGTDDKVKRWIYGNLLDEKLVGIVAIQDENCHVWEVEPLSWGQYTGFKDIDGKEIYEGDILETKDETLGVAVVLWNEVGGGWSLNMMSDYADLNKHNVEALKLKVVGTMFEAEQEGRMEGLI